MPAPPAHAWPALYEQLGHCATYAKAAASSVNPSPSYQAAGPTLYVFSIGAADPTTATLLIRNVVHKLSEAAPNVAVIGRADWSAMSSFTAQCQADSNTVGGLVIENAYAQTFTYSYVALSRGAVRIAGNVEALRCSGEDHSASAPTVSLWSSQTGPGAAIDRTGSGEWGLPLGPIGSVIALLSKNTNTTTVTTSPQPVTGPSVPPLTTATTATVKQDVTPSVVVGAIAGTLSAITIPSQNVPRQTNWAAGDFGSAVLTRLSVACVPPTLRPHATPNPDGSAPRLTQAQFLFSDYCAALHLPIPTVPQP